MNRKQLILLVVALAIIGGASLVLTNRHQESWTQDDSQLGSKLLKDFQGQVNDVAVIHIKGDSDLNLVRKDEGWRVQERGNYPANMTQIREMLIKMADLKIVQSEPVGSTDLGRLHLQDPGKGAEAAVLVEFKNGKGTVLQSLLVGKKHTQKSERPSPMPYGDEGFADGRYVMLTSDPKDVLTISDPLNSVAAKPAEWLNKDFFKVEKPQSISFVSTNATNSWTVTRATESSPWIMEDVKTNEIVDTNKLASLASTLSWPSFIDVASDPSKTGMDKPEQVIIKTFDHFAYTLKIGSKNAANDYNLNVAVTADLPSQREAGKDEKADVKTKLDKEFKDKTKQLQDKLTQEKALAPWTYQVNGWLIDPLIRDRSQLMVDKNEKKTASTSEPAPGAEPPAMPELPVGATPEPQ